MDENRPMTKKEIKAARHLEKLAQKSAGKSSDNMKWIIMVIGTVIFLGFFGTIIFLIKQNQNKPVTLAPTGYVRGTGKVTLTEFGDFQCPACRAYEPFVRKISQDFKGKVKVVYKNFPLTLVHKNAVYAAHAAVAAGNQGKFWEMHDWMYDNQDSWGELPAADAQEQIAAEAKNLKLDMDRFGKDVKSSETAAVVTQTQDEGTQIGVDATPTFYLDNKKIENNPQNYDDFKKLVQAEIK